MIPALQDRFVVEVEQAGLVFSIAIVAFTLAVLVAARPPFPPRGTRTGAFYCMIAGPILIASIYAPSFAWFVLFYAVGFGFCSGAIYLSCLDVAARQPPKRANFLTGYMVASFGIGGAAFGPALRVLVAQGFGLGALLLPGIALFGIGVISLALTRNQASSEREAGLRSARSLSVGPAMVVVWFGFAFAAATGLMILGLAGTFIEQAGGGVALVSIGLAAVALANTAGRLGAGLLTSWMPVRHLAVLASVLSIVGLAISVQAWSPMAMIAGVSVIAGAYGLVASTYPILTRTIFGAENFSGAFSVIFTAWGVAGLTSPWAAGYLFDRTGSFDGAIMGGAIAAVLALLVALAIARWLLPRA